jgi:TonB family protein
MRIRASFRNRGLRFLALSVAVHLTVSTFLFFSPRHRVVPVVAQSPIKYFPVTLYLPGGSRTEWTRKPPGRKRLDQSVKKPASDLIANARPAPPAGSPISAQHDPVAGNGSDTQKSDPTFPVFSPHPPVTDRSLLPSSMQQVVVDVKVSASGEVLEATLVKGIGNALDKIVLDTVKTWRFQPATINGNPVATEAELIFPFDGKYPTTPS